MNTATIEDIPEVKEEPSIVLTPDQEAALATFQQFLCSPVEQVMVLSGYSGCGKSTLVKTILDQLPNFLKTQLLLDPDTPGYMVTLTATTNKAAENFALITGHPCGTIHSFLGLRVQTDYNSGKTTLIPRNKNDIKHGYLLFIDEASYVDKQLLDYIFKMTKDCKIVFIGDPAQLTPVKSTDAPVFKAGFLEASLTTVVRQAEGNPIIDLSTKFRHTVNTGEFPTNIVLDGHHVKHMNRDDFDQAITDEFTRPNWRYKDSKFLAWTNKKVVFYNQAIRNLIKGDPHFEEGDYAVCNSYIQIGNKSIKTDALVQISSISEDVIHNDVSGNWFNLDGTISAFMPKTLASKNARLKQARASNEYSLIQEIENQWIDLRGAYAQTVNKSQGSTYDRVYIDLDDISGCNSGDQIARMLYVAISRARHQVFLTGDFGK